jgi:hypothetical protein
MRVRYETWTMGRSAKAVIAVGLLVALLVAAVPAALLAGLIMMLLGHVVGGLAVFGASVLVAVAAVAAAVLGGVRHLRKLVSQPDQRADHPMVQLRPGEYHYN